MRILQLHNSFPLVSFLLCSGVIRPPTEGYDDMVLYLFLEVISLINSLYFFPHRDKKTDNKLNPRILFSFHNILYLE